MPGCNVARKKSYKQLNASNLIVCELPRVSARLSAILFYNYLCNSARLIRYGYEYSGELLDLISDSTLLLPQLEKHGGEKLIREGTRKILDFAFPVVSAKRVQRDAVR